MSVQQAPVPKTLPKDDHPIISKRIASPTPRPATPPSPGSSSSTVSEEDVYENSVQNTPDSDSDPAPPGPEKILDMDIFQQILDLDEVNHDFSLSMVQDYFEQAQETFLKLDRNVQDENLAELSALGHFLKGSSAAIGLVKVQNSCERIQHFGVRRDEKAKQDLKPEEALDRIKTQLAQLREEYAEGERYLKEWFREN